MMMTTISSRNGNNGSGIVVVWCGVARHEHRKRRHWWLKHKYTHTLPALAKGRREKNLFMQSRRYVVCTFSSIIIKNRQKPYRCGIDVKEMKQMNTRTYLHRHTLHKTQRSTIMLCRRRIPNFTWKQKKNEIFSWTLSIFFSLLKNWGKIIHLNVMWMALFSASCFQSYMCMHNAYDHITHNEHFSRVLCFESSSYLKREEEEKKLKRKGVCVMHHLLTNKIDGILMFSSYLTFCFRLNENENASNNALLRFYAVACSIRRIYIFIKSNVIVRTYMCV